MNHNWTDDIRNKLEGYTEQPPCHDPMALCDRMAKAARKARRKAIIMTLGPRLAAAAAVLAIAIPATITMLQHSHDDTSAPTTINSHTTSRPNTPLASHSQPSPSEPATVTTVSADYLAYTSPAPRAAIEVLKSESSADQQVHPATDAAVTALTTAKPQEHPADPAAHSAAPRRQRSLLPAASPQSSVTTSPHPISASLSLGAAATDRGINTATSTAMLTKADPFGWHASQFRGENSMPALAQDNPTTTSSHHSQPITIAMTIGYRLNRHWSLSTGLSYSYHKSEFSASGDNYSSLTTRRLHYIGVPVAASYTLWSNRHLSVYATAGGSIEKAVAGKADTRTIVNGKEQNSDSHNVSISALQLSANAALGAQLLLAPRLAAYAEPGVSYHFHNGSSVPTFYSDNPLAFSLRIGLRMIINR